MKRIKFLLMALLPLFFFVSCEKPDGNGGGNEGGGNEGGNDEPETTVTKKISKVYTDYEGEKMLIYSYNWDGDILKEFYLCDGAEPFGTFSFTYNSDNKVVAMHYYEPATEYWDEYSEDYTVTYTDNTLTVDCVVDNEPYSQYIYTLAKDKVIRIDITEYNYFATFAQSKKNRREVKFHPFRLQSDILAKVAKAGKAEGDEEENYDLTYSVVLEYTDDNVTKATETLEDEGETYTYTYLFTYDKGNNPLYLLFDEYGSWGPVSLSKNNILTQSIEGEEGVYTREYTYDEDNYPESFYYNDGDGDEGTLFYEYIK